MDFSIGALIPGFIFGVIGFYILKEGRRNTHLPWIVIGIGMIGYAYFFTNLLLLWGIGIGLVALAFQMR